MTLAGANADLFDLLLFFRRADETDEPISELDNADVGLAGIRCPQCKWRPNKWSLWYCGPVGHPEYYFDGCGTEWNAFDTAGLCPNCRHQWVWTACLRCGEWSKHADWYEDDRELL